MKKVTTKEKSIYHMYLVFAIANWIVLFAAS